MRRGRVLADLHCAPTPQTVANLRGEGVPAAKIELTGNTIVEATLGMLPDEAAAREIAAELDRPDHRPGAVHEPERLQTITSRDQSAALRHSQPRKIPLHILASRHDDET